MGRVRVRVRVRVIMFTKVPMSVEMREWVCEFSFTWICQHVQTSPPFPSSLTSCLSFMAFTGAFASDEEKHYACIRGGWVVVVGVGGRETTCVPGDKFIFSTCLILCL